MSDTALTGKTPPPPLPPPESSAKCERKSIVIDGIADPMQHPVNASDADVKFLSADNVLFHIHRKNLESQAGAFPPAEFDTRGEIVPLTENAATLELLFRFLYPKRHPHLDTTPFEELSPLAEAAEKYEIYSAVNVCRIRMKNFLPEHAVEIFNYASRHDYREIMAEAAPSLLDIPLDEIVLTLSPGFVIPWGLSKLVIWAGRGVFGEQHELSEGHKFAWREPSSLGFEILAVDVKFNASDADVQFISADNVIFHLHRKNLETHTSAFPTAEFNTHGELVPLTENALTLELLFQFVYPQRHPRLDNTPFEELSLLAEAAEKYEVYSAMNICSVRMKYV
ncbi:hypothetical protein H0H81_004232 [Sphagnurus paluster]|uniref:BTB domain-containing protein n=1 Tax=Sphagnurus paluster TaxID=117069 RepID=A0A9P7FUT2_9AGAR|nr:hypothetical protein H0H81_004232 [Sphagnurus paluster]